MSKLSNVANKFAMKLGLESRPTVPYSEEMPDFDEENSEEFGELRDFVPPPPEESAKYLNRKKEVFKYYFDNMSIDLFDLKEKSSLGDYDAMLETIDTMLSNLTALKDFVSEQSERPAAE